MKKHCVFFVREIGYKYKETSKHLINSLNKFHPDIPVKIYTEYDLQKYNINLETKVAGLTTFIPLFAKELIQEYELVISLDSDQIILGDLNYIINQRHTYDMGMVENLNKIDPLNFAIASLPGIPPNEYYNLGLVALTSETAIDHLLRLCNSKYCDRFIYRDQDIFNIVAHFGNYRVKNFDAYDYKGGYFAWHGLKAKGEGVRMKLVNGKVILPKDNDYPARDTLIKAYHWAGGNKESKMNFYTHFKDDMQNYIEWLVSDTTEPYKV